MAEFFENSNPVSLLTAMDANMLAFWSAYGRGQGASLQITPGYTWFHTGIADPLFNGVFSINLKAEQVKELVERVQARMDELGGPVLWWLSQLAAPANLGALLEQYGLHPAGELPGMLVDLAQLNEHP